MSEKMAVQALPESGFIAAEEARSRVWDRAPLLGAEWVSLDQAAGRVVFENIYARLDLPLFTNSAVDGYAVRARDAAGAAPDRPASLPLRRAARAGDRPGTLRPGEAMKIMTGAPAPAGCDAVVMKEHAEETADGCARIFRAPSPGDALRRRGEDVRAGELLLSRGARLRPWDAALLAAQGLAGAPVGKRPEVFIVVSGSELAAGAPPEPGQIFDANGPALAAALSRLGVNSRRRLVPDEPALLETALAEALNAADVLLVSGGVSVGDFDYTRRCLDRLGFREIFWRVAIKPGMPLLFGLCPSRSGGPDKPVFGLPGNPLSALVCFEEFVRPALDRMQGAASAPSLYAWEGAALNDFPKPLQRQQFIFCRAEPGPGGYGLSLFRPQGSALLARASAANALAVSPCGVGRVRAGDRLPFRWLA